MGTIVKWSNIETNEFVILYGFFCSFSRALAICFDFNLMKRSVVAVMDENLSGDFESLLNSCVIALINNFDIIMECEGSLRIECRRFNLLCP